MKRVKLKVMGISYSQTQSGAYALLLIEENGDRRIPIIIGGFEAQAIVIKLENLEPPRPLTHDLFKKVADQFNIAVIEVIIDKLEEGVFFSKLVCNNGEKEYIIDSRTSDAVAIALRFGCPIYINEEILEKAQLTNAPSDTDIVSEEGTGKSEEAGSEFSHLSDEELYKMIDEAVKTEDYEKAASIRDELEKRKKSRKQQ
ncbi:MAG TPA: bifunctional nuclease family protein [Bacteroidales bacterium]|nr:bifunctional nuclease family protein [Bacteroidales bacterium]HPI67802.1 bifunctional nuclease family protein [Bacteroidales bacterium]HPR72343.1 bifunctional nuclease family protein [Bacteroidales bacterium]